MQGGAHMYVEGKTAVDIGGSIGTLGGSVADVYTDKGLLVGLGGYDTGKADGLLGLGG